MNDSKYKKIIIFTVLIILIVSWLVLNFYYFSKDKNSKNEIIWVHVKEKPYTSSWLLVWEKDKERTIETDNDLWKQNTEKTNAIKSYLRTFCKSYDDVNLLVTSNYFKLLKEKVDDFEKNTGKFIYIELPTYVYESCTSKSPEYLETLILYLQTSNQDIPEIKNKINNTVLENYIKDLTLVEEWKIPSKIKNKENFNNFFLNEQIVDLESFYYPYYVKEKNNVSSFLNKPIFSLDWDNKNKELALNKLIIELNKLWINWLDEFKKLLLTNNDFKDIEDVKKSIIQDYNNITSKDTELKNILNNLWEYKSYINTWKYKEISNNKEIDWYLKNLWKKMLIFSIVNTDYADWLNETWSGKEFFWNEETWNGIIRLNFIYILTQ